MVNLCHVQTDKSAVEKAIENAKETCEQGNVGACAAAWDEVRPTMNVPTSIHMLRSQPY